MHGDQSSTMRHHHRGAGPIGPGLCGSSLAVRYRRWQVLLPDAPELYAFRDLRRPCATGGSTRCLYSRPFHPFGLCGRGEWFRGSRIASRSGAPLGGLAGLIASLVGLRRASPEPGAMGYAVLAGIFLGVHLALWIISLAYTSIVASATIVTTNPIWVALILWLWRGETPSHLTAAAS